MRDEQRYWILSQMYRMARLRGVFASPKNRVQIVSMHSVAPQYMDNFRAILDFFTRQFTVVSYSDAVGRILDSKIDGQYLALTFDDDHRCWRDVSALLKSYGISACFFLCPGILDRHIQAGKRNAFNWTDAENLLSAGHEVGGHTSHHVDLGKADPGAMQDEIGGCYELITSRLGRPKHFAWPYGTFANMTRESRKAVFEAGYVSCASAVRGAHVGEFHGTPSDLCIRRDNIEPRWPLTNVKYFMLRNGFTAKREHGFPEHLR